MQKYLGIVAVALCTALLAYYGWQWLFREPPESPKELAEQALAGTPEKQELAAAGLERVAGKFDKTGKRNPAQEYLAQVLLESKNPGVRAACMRGLATIWDYECVPAMLDALDDESPQVRSTAAAAVQTLLGVDCHFQADDPPEIRQEAVRLLRNHWKNFSEKKRQRWEERLEEKDKGGPSHAK
jgi:hypothetical protein